MGCGASTEIPTVVGDLKITIHQARGLPDKDILGAMDPYTKIFVGDVDQKTKVHSKGGIEPKWIETLNFRVSATPDDTVELEIWDDDVGFDDFCAQTSITLDVLIPTTEPTWFPLYDKENKEPAGEIEISVDFKGSGAELCAEPIAYEDDGGEDVGYYDTGDGTFIDSYGNTVDEEGTILNAYDDSTYDESWGQPQEGYTVIQIGGHPRRVRKRQGTFRVKKGAGPRTKLKRRNRKPPVGRRPKANRRPNKRRQKQNKKRRGGRGGKKGRGKGGKGGGKRGRGGKGGKKGRGKGGKRGGGKRGGKGGKRR